jgi:hypothetical protein
LKEQLMRRGKVTEFSVALIMTLGLLGCGASEGEGVSGSGQPSEPALPEVTSLQADQAMSDAMLVSAGSLFLAFSAEDGAYSATNEDGSLKLEWDNSADFTTGIGLYTITMTNYSIPADDPFSEEYNGYVLDGTAVMGSADGISTTIRMDLTTSHENPEQYPVQSIDMNLEGIQDSTQQMPTGHIKINGREISIEDLS